MLLCLLKTNVVVDAQRIVFRRVCVTQIVDRLCAKPEVQSHTTWTAAKRECNFVLSVYVNREIDDGRAESKSCMFSFTQPVGCRVFMVCCETGHSQALAPFGIQHVQCTMWSPI